jgi:inorganic phosphate transporter, PiT family
VNDLAPIAILLYALLFVSVMLVSGNNLSSCLGTAVGARIVGQKTAVVLGSAGFILGLLTIGHDMTNATQSLLHLGGDLIFSEILLSTIFIFFLGNRLRVPLSISMALVGMLVGISIAHDLPIDSTYIISALVLWTTAPLVAMAIMFGFVRLAISKSDPKNLWSRLRLLKILVLAASFSTAFASGSNSVALLVSIPGFSSSNLLVAIAGIMVGTSFFSAGEIKRVGSEILLMRYANAFLTLVTSACLIVFANLSGIPLSSTQTLSVSVFRTGISYKHKLISTRPFALIVLGWVVAPLLSFVIGWLVI